MKRMIVFFALLLTIAFVTIRPLPAHERFRIIGTVTRFDKSQFEVTTKEKKIITIKLDQKTIMRRDKEKVNRQDLKKGLSVVVDAIGDSLADLVAIEIRIVPAITAPVAKE